MKKAFGMLAVLFTTLIIISCSEQKTQATVLQIDGVSKVQRNGKTTNLKVADKLYAGDVIAVEENAALVIELSDNIGKMELQAGTVFHVGDYSMPEKTLDVKKGNVWTMINKLKKGNALKLKTPTQIAAVRGTKFYTFKIGEIEGVCHCEGNIEYKNTTSDYSGSHEQHYFVVNKNGTTVLITQQDFIDAGIVSDPTHNHSSLSGSELGKQADPDMVKKVIALANEKLDEATAAKSK